MLFSINTRWWIAAASLTVFACAGGLLWQLAGNAQLPVVSAWSWFSGPRAIVVDQRLLIGSVDGQGYSRVDVVDLASQKITDSQQLSTRTEVDDHNNPALLSLGGNRLLIAYARHGRDEQWFSRLGRLDPHSGTIRWDEESTHDVAVMASDQGTSDGSAAGGARMRASVTYCNLMRLESEKNRIYNFFRGLNFNPCFSFSDDDGHTWSPPQFLMKIGAGQVRPYVKYFCNGRDRIDFLYTEAHPRNQNTSIYHCYYQAGELFRSDGTRIGALPASQAEPLHPFAGTRVFDGTQHPAWVWDVRRTAGGELIAAFVVSHDGAAGKDLRYYYATATDGNWQVQQIAYAGKHLYEPENHYAGGIVIDAVDPQAVYVSSNVDPNSGAATASSHNRLYRGHRDATQGKFQWEPLDGTASGNQLRPFSLAFRGTESATTEETSLLLWLEGKYSTYTNYQTHVHWLTIERQTADQTTAPGPVTEERRKNK